MIKVIEEKKTYTFRCHCDALLSYEWQDLEQEEGGKFCYEYIAYYIRCPKCGSRNFIKSVDKF